MASFNLTTTPTTLNLKPGDTGTIVVVVSNRLGKPFLARVDANVTPATASNWVIAPPDAQRQFSPDPAATHSFEFKFRVPAGVKPQPIQFRADVVDPQHGDDPMAQGETVGITVIDSGEPVRPGPGIPWWVWVVGAVVLLGAGFGIYLAVKPSGAPDVKNMTAAAATEKLTKAGYAAVTVKDSLGDSPDTNVVAQLPEAGAKVEKDDTATIYVNRPATVVPSVVGLHIAVAIERLREADLRIGTTPGRWTGVLTQDDKIAEVSPGPGAKVMKGQAVSLTIFAYSAVKPPDCVGILCAVAEKPMWRSEARLKLPPR